MRNQIFYRKAGEFNLSVLIVKMNEHKELFNNLFGENNWVFTGSAAVIIYALKYIPDMVNMLDEPADFDFLIKSKNLLTNKSIGNYNIRKHESIERSYTFINSTTNKSIDVISVLNFKKLEVNGFPLLDISLLLEEYIDVLSGMRDKDIRKIEILNKISSLIERPKEEDIFDYTNLECLKRGPLF